MQSRNAIIHSVHPVKPGLAAFPCETGGQLWSEHGRDIRPARASLTSETVRLPRLGGVSDISLLQLRLFNALTAAYGSGRWAKGVRKRRGCPGSSWLPSADMHSKEWALAMRQAPALPSQQPSVNPL